MADNIFTFPGVTPPVIGEPEEPPVSKVLDAATAENLDSVLIVGMKNNQHKIFSSDPNAANMVFLLECAKIVLFNAIRIEK